jgi:hypothetical protein
MFKQVLNVDIGLIQLHRLIDRMYSLMHESYRKTDFKNYGKFDNVSFSVKKHILHHDSNHIDRHYFLLTQLPNHIFKYGCVFLIDGFSWDYFMCIFENGAYFCCAASAKEGRNLYKLKNAIMREVDDYCFYFGDDNDNNNDDDKDEDE